MLGFISQDAGEFFPKSRQAHTEAIGNPGLP